MIDLDISRIRQGSSVHVVDNSHRKVVFRRLALHILKYIENMGGTNVLSADSDSSAHNHGLIFPSIVSGLDIHIKRLRLGVNLLHPVENRDNLYRLRDILEEIFQGERPV